MPYIASASLFPEVAVNKKNARAGWAQVLWYSLILTASIYIIRVFNVAPSAGITDLAIIFIPGFIIHSLVPVRYRLPVYCLIFLACLFYIFNWLTAMVIVSILAVTAYVIFGEMKLAWKYLYVALLATVLILLRKSFLLYMPRVNISIPFAATILMFRVIIILYEVKHAKIKDSSWMKLSYFLCFPNLAFMFYPIIDYRAYSGSYYGASFATTCNRGVSYLTTGIVLLLLHKYLLYHLDVSYASVHDIYSLLWFLACKYVIVVKVTGLLILGLSFLYFFGFDMPVLFGNFFIATSFNSYWQKVNIYWKDFVVKLVYYPLYFRYRKKLKYVVTLCIMTALMSSWIFHVYQRFWMSGGLSFQLQEMLYWLALAILVAIDVYITGKIDRKARSGPRDKLRKGGGFVLVFSTMLVLWFLWNSPNVSFFAFIMAKGMHATPAQVMTVGTALVLLIAGYALYLQAISGFKPAQSQVLKWRTGFSLGLLCALCVIGAMKPGFSKNSPGDVIMSKEIVGIDDKEKSEIDYYAAVMETKNDNWEVGLAWGDQRSLFGQIGVYSNDLLFQLLQPNKRIVFKGHSITTNSYGLRDKDYPLIKPSGTWRIVMVGGSYEAGAGVGDDEMFEHMVEDSLNSYYKGDPGIELINFSMGSFTSVPQMEMFRVKALQFHPDELFVFYHTNEMRRASRFFARYITNGVDLRYDYLKQIKERAGIKQSMSIEEIVARLNPFMPDITEWCWREMATVCRANNIKPIWLFLPTTGDKLGENELEDFMTRAKQAGFETYTLGDVFKGYEPARIAVSEEDSHPNALGHRLIANKFFNLLTDTSNHIIPHR